MLKAQIASAALLALTAGSSLAQGAKPYWPADARVYIISPKDCETVPSSIAALFGLKGVGVAPVGILAFS